MFHRRGASIIELILVVGIVVIVATAGMINLAKRKSNTETSTVVTKVAALLREAQSRSMSQASSSSWGVHFENGTSSFYSLFAGTYSTTTRENVYSLPPGIQFVTSTVAQDRHIEITFAQVSGVALGSTSVAIVRIGSSTVSSTITIDPSGAISY